jgi:hypothetical protein
MRGNTGAAEPVYPYMDSQLVMLYFLFSCISFDRRAGRNDLFLQSAPSQMTLQDSR